MLFLVNTFKIWVNLFRGIKTNEFNINIGHYVLTNKQNKVNEPIIILGVKNNTLDQSFT